jgi:hypothetical protein
MKLPHRNFHSRAGRSGFAILLLLSASFVCSRGAWAQDDALSVSSIADVDAVPSGDAKMRAYIETLPSAPTPKIEPAAGAFVQSQVQSPNPAARTRGFYWLDRKSLMYGLVQGGAEIFDGVTTRYFIHHCSLCFENDPMSRLLLGTHPSWGKMIPMGIAEAAASTYSYRRLSHSPNRFLRGVAPLVPVGLTAVHVIEGARNISLKNRYRCADPGYVVVGAVCVMAQSSVLTSVPGPMDSGLDSRHNPL